MFPRSTHIRGKKGMLKKIALVGIFAVTSIVSFKPSNANAESASRPNPVSSITGIARGWCPGMQGIRCN